MFLESNIPHTYIHKSSRLYISKKSPSSARDRFVSHRRQDTYCNVPMNPNEVYPPASPVLFSSRNLFDSEETSHLLAELEMNPRTKRHKHGHRKNCDSNKCPSTLFNRTLGLSQHDNKRSAIKRVGVLPVQDAPVKTPQIVVGLPSVGEEGGSGKARARGSTWCFPER